MCGNNAKAMNWNLNFKLLVNLKNGSAYKQKNTNDNEFMDVDLKIYTEQRVARW